MRELIIQGFPYWGYGGSPPVCRKFAQPPLPVKIPPVDHQHSVALLFECLIF